jgi:hypothetical protein
VRVGVQEKEHVGCSVPAGVHAKTGGGD